MKTQSTVVSVTDTFEQPLSGTTLSNPLSHLNFSPE